jgi:capsular polysaccharide biosynthesis protein
MSVLESESGVAVSAAESGMSAETGAEGGNSLASKSAAVRRYWWIVLAVVCLAVVGALVSTARTPTAYLGRTSLIVSSNDRAPEQDAVLVQGYVSYFNNAAYQQQLLAATGADAKAALSAEAAAASPIVVISATASDPERAQSTAIVVAKAFKDDINRTHDQKIAAALATLQNELNTARGRHDETAIAALQERIGELQADRSNVLQELQDRGGVSVQSPSLFSNLVLALAGSLVMGVLAALALAKFSPRLRSRHDVADKVGLNTLVELPGPRSKGAPLWRKRRLRQLANILRARLAGPGVVVVTPATDGAATLVVARGLAVEWATQGYPTVLVRFGGDLESLPSRTEETAPVAPAEASAVLSRMRAGCVPGMSTLDLRPRLARGTTGLPAMKVTELLELDELVGAFIIIETPAVVHSAAAQAASLAADATILVIDTQVAKVHETREAVRVLRQPGVVLLGAVLAPVVDEEDTPDRSHLDKEDTPDRSHLDQGNGHQPPSSGPDAWLLAPWASATGSAEGSWPPASSGLTDSSERRSLPDNVTEPAHDAARNGLSSRGLPTGRR